MSVRHRYSREASSSLTAFAALSSPDGSKADHFSDISACKVHNIFLYTTQYTLANVQQSARNACSPDWTEVTLPPPAPPPCYTYSCLSMEKHHLTSLILTRSLCPFRLSCSAYFLELHLCTPTHPPTHTHPHTHPHPPTHTHTPTHTPTHTHTHTHKHTHTHTHTHTHFE